MSSDLDFEFNDEVDYCKIKLIECHKRQKSGFYSFAPYEDDFLTDIVNASREANGKLLDIFNKKYKKSISTYFFSTMVGYEGFEKGGGLVQFESVSQEGLDRYLCRDKFTGRRFTLDRIDLYFNIYVEKRSNMGDRGRNGFKASVYSDKIVFGDIRTEYYTYTVMWN